jgi:REP element-mobilizing transposase RayT
MEEFFNYAIRGAKSRYRRKRLVDGRFYHVWKRRDDCGIVFRDGIDRTTYIEIMQRLLDPEEFRDERGRRLKDLPCEVKLLAFCILDDHFHLVLWVEKAEGLSAFMHRLQTAYGQRFNNRHGRKGPVFDERYDAELIEDTYQLKRAIAYVHANPGAEADTYEWSGHQLYLDRSKASKASTWFSADAGLEAFGGRTNYLEWFMRAVAARKRKNRNAN